MIRSLEGNRMLLENIRNLGYELSIEDMNEVMSVVKSKESNNTEKMHPLTKTFYQLSLVQQEKENDERIENLIKIAFC